MDKGRQLKYNFLRSEDCPTSTEWFFLIVNEPREINEIQAKIYRLFQHVFNEGKTIQGKVKGNSLSYKLLNFCSEKYIWIKDIKRIYQRTIKEAHLYHRKTTDGLENYLAEYLEKE